MFLLKLLKDFLSKTLLFFLHLNILFRLLLVRKVDSSHKMFGLNSILTNLRTKIFSTDDTGLLRIIFGGRLQDERRLLNYAFAFR